MANRYSPRKDYAGLNASWQGVNPSSGGIQMYSGIDSLKNMTIQDDCIYVSVSQDQHALLQSGQQLPTDRYPALSGYFTDEATASRRFTGQGQYDAAGLAADLQQAPRYDPDSAMEAAMNGQDYSPTFNGNLACLTIDRDRLNEVYHTRDLNAAVGKCLSNDHLGPGGGNQGFNSDLTELYNNGCLKYDASRSRTSQNMACQDYDAMQSRAEARTQDCLSRRERTPSPEVCAQTGTGPANPVQSQPFHSTEVQEAHYYDGLHQRLHDPDLFQNNAPGDYQYVQTTYGKFAEGTLGNEPGKRNLSDQRTVGGADRRPTDDGGHLIGSRFQGSGNLENLEAQDRNLNRGSYKQMENRWAAAQDAGDQIFVHSESFRSNGSQRPDAFMGYAIYEHPDGTREWEAFSYQNESAATQQEWNDALDRFDPNGICIDNSLNPRDYNPADYEEELSSMDGLNEAQAGKQAPDQHQGQVQDESQKLLEGDTQEQLQDENQQQGQNQNLDQEQEQDLSMDNMSQETPDQSQLQDQNQNLDQEQDLSMDGISQETPDQSQLQDQNQNLDQEQDQDLSMDDMSQEMPDQSQLQDQNQSLDQDQDPSMDNMSQETPDQSQLQDQNQNLDQEQDQNLSMDGMSQETPDQSQLQDQNQNLDQEQDQNLSMDNMSQETPDQSQLQDQNQNLDQEQDQNLSMDGMSQETPDQSQLQDQNQNLDQEQDLSMDQMAQQEPQEEQNQEQNEDLSMDQMAQQEPQEEQNQEQDNSAGEEQSSGQEEDQSQGYSY